MLVIVGLVIIFGGVGVVGVDVVGSLGEVVGVEVEPLRVSWVFER